MSAGRFRSAHDSSLQGSFILRLLPEVGPKIRIGFGSGKARVWLCAPVSHGGKLRETFVRLKLLVFLAFHRNQGDFAILIEMDSPSILLG